MVISVPNITKTAGDLRDLSCRVKVETFVLTFLQKLRKLNHDNSRFFISKVVDRHELQSSRYNDMTNLNSRNKIKNITLT